MSEKEILAYAMNGEAQQIKELCKIVTEVGVAHWNAKLLNELTAVYLDTEKKWENASNDSGDEYDSRIKERTESEFFVGEEEAVRKEKEKAKKKIRKIREQDEENRYVRNLEKEAEENEYEL